MKDETSGKKDAIQKVGPSPEPRSILFAQTPNAGMTIGVVSDSEPSSLALLAAGVAGMAARRARSERTKTK
jgi:PEP-CTERM motif-containing protein